MDRKPTGQSSSNSGGPCSKVASFEQFYQRALKLVDARAPRPDILSCLTTAAESIAGQGCVASILVLDENGLLRNGASPNLPGDYLKAIDRLKPDANVGTCAAAAATGEIVVTPDFQADDKWAELRHLPGSLGFVGAWSMPIKNDDGTVLGTFGTYFREAREPSDDEMKRVALLATLAASVLAKSQLSD